MTRFEELTEKFWVENECDKGGVIDRKFVQKLIEWVYRCALCDVVAIMEDFSGLSLIAGTKEGSNEKRN